MKAKLFITAAVVAAGIFTSCCDKAADTATADATQAVIDNIMTRTSIRSFTPEAISADTLDVLVKAGMAAPTAVNAQPWSFIVITDRTTMDSLAAVHPYSRLDGAAAAIVVCGDMDKALKDEAREYWIQDCSAATENILLAAHAYGLGAVWCGVYPNSERVADVSGVLRLPATLIPLNIITMGHPAENPAPKDKWKPENVRYITGE